MDPDKVLLQKTQPDFAILAVECDVITIPLVRGHVAHNGIGLSGVHPRNPIDG
jgi:hypothetical protein